jgi:hypothetical protein
MTYSSHYRPSLQQGYRVFLLSILLMGFCTPAHSVVLPALVVDATHEYFPDQIGNEWVYRGRMFEGRAVQIAEKNTQFTNVSKVIGKETIDGVEVIVFHDTNPGNQGPSDSFYRRDAAGIRYYGSKPGTTLERQLVPYQIVRFPLAVPSSFEQFNRHGLELGMDIDRDGEEEKVDIVAISSALVPEMVRVPAGTYPQAIRLEAKMTMQVHLSESGKTIKGTDTMTAWFARGVGLLKYIERQTIPSSRSENERVVEVTEELEKVNMATDVASLYEGNSNQVGVLKNNRRIHEWLRMAIAFPLSPDF